MEIRKEENKSRFEKKTDLSKIAVIAFQKDGKKIEVDTLDDYPESCNWSVCHCAMYSPMRRPDYKSA